MPTKPTKGKKQFATQIEASLLDEFRGYAKTRGESITEATERALRREMTYPPPPPVPPAIVPLPDAGLAAAAGEIAATGRKKATRGPAAGSAKNRSPRRR